MHKNLHKNTKKELIDEILKLRDELGKERGKVKELEWKLNKNSKNSSKPSGTEWFKKHTTICNSRKKWQNPRWGKKGHTWANLKRNENVNETIDVTPKECSNCWTELLKKFSKFVKKKTRQVIDMFTPSMAVRDYIWSEIKCPKCWFLNQPNFPEWVTKPVQYWPEIKAFTTYMYNYQMPSYERLQDFLREITGLKISQTSLTNFNKTWFDNLEPFEKLIIQSLIKKEQVHADETWARVDWKVDRIHVNSNEELTYLYHHDKRWREAIKDMWVLENFKWNCITDNLPSYLAYEFEHYLCNAHHLRELTWVEENEEKKWATNISKFLIKYKREKEKIISNWIFTFEKDKLKDIHEEYRDILKRWKLEYEKVVRKKWQRWKLKKEKWLNLLERLEKKEKWALGFLDNFSIPFDNNLAERDLRMVKTRIKVSGCFRSEEWAKWFCRIRSYISTMKKQDLDIYKSIQSIFKWDLILPEF